MAKQRARHENRQIKRNETKQTRTQNKLEPKKNTAVTKRELNVHVQTIGKEWPWE
jgi:hypothetical protein